MISRTQKAPMSCTYAGSKGVLAHQNSSSCSCPGANIEITGKSVGEVEAVSQVKTRQIIGE